MTTDPSQPTPEGREAEISAAEADLARWHCVRAIADARYRRSLAEAIGAEGPARRAALAEAHRQLAIAAAARRASLPQAKHPATSDDNACA